MPAQDSLYRERARFWSGLYDDRFANLGNMLTQAHHLMTGHPRGRMTVSSRAWPGKPTEYFE